MFSVATGLVSLNVMEFLGVFSTEILWSEWNLMMITLSSAIAILPSCLPPRDLASTSIYLTLQKGTNLLQIYHISCLKRTIFFYCRVCDVPFISKVRSCISIASAHTSEHMLTLWLDRYLGRNEDSEILWWEDLCMGWSESAEVYIW